MNCHTCKHYHDDPPYSGVDGTCRIRPPAAQPWIQPAMMPDVGAVAWSLFPPTMQGNWCGEHPARKAAQP